MNTVKCLHCRYENKNTNIRCEACETKLMSSTGKTIDLENKQTKFIICAILIFMLMPEILSGLAGLIFLSIGIYFDITDINKSKNYLETKGKLVDFQYCQYDDDIETCKAVYEYTINNTPYRGSPRILSSRQSFSKTTTVKYNSNNPSEYVISSGWNSLSIVGILTLIIPLVIFIPSRKIFKELW